ncbi:MULTISPECIES: hydrolase 1, exosortase A system-associated [unclassified Novosphingobium]|uniref:hydrolase 1, exosortase A system-associated n=1 Tax=unclassified Novosphingobium TaxID=2644732 RepID=UPI00146B129C|nr:MULTISPECIES: hydrolase 1, exosortase A system-associated [unclassified Novosphingobium]NMN03656.1 exosortase A-associated hydrolase 1 [Novosphingobium sp. SG919]NMN86354.1 exosortase A-associated hydrolase 1 [Novosphingobium sp. SG916]
MNRHVIAFACQGSQLFGTLDMGTASGAVGVLIVSGGNEIRSGAWGGQSTLSARLAREGVPTFRFDRRGVGDSAGENQGFRASAPDIAAALAAFRAAAPHVKRVFAMGNCDAASALMLNAATLPGLDGVIGCNPWTVDAENETAPVHSAAALRRHYLRRLSDPRQWVRLLAGKVALGKLAGGLRTAAGPQARSALAEDMRNGLAGYAGRVTILLAQGDRTAQLFASHWGQDSRVIGHASTSHSFADAQDWLVEQVLETLR